MAEHAVIRAEIMPPLRDAVGFVDGNQGRLAFRKHLRETGHAEPFRRDEQKLQFAVEVIHAGLARGPAVPAGMNAVRGETPLL